MRYKSLIFLFLFGLCSLSFVWAQSDGFIYIREIAAAHHIKSMRLVRKPAGGIVAHFDTKGRVSSVQSSYWDNSQKQEVSGWPIWLQWDGDQCVARLTKRPGWDGSSGHVSMKQFCMVTYHYNEEDLEWKKVYYHNDSIPYPPNLKPAHLIYCDRPLAEEGVLASESNHYPDSIVFVEHYRGAQLLWTSRHNSSSDSLSHPCPPLQLDDQEMAYAYFQEKAVPYPAVSYMRTAKKKGPFRLADDNFYPHLTFWKDKTRKFEVIAGALEWDHVRYTVKYTRAGLIKQIYTQSAPRFKRHCTKWEYEFYPD